MQSFDFLPVKHTIDFLKKPENRCYLNQLLSMGSVGRATYVDPYNLLCVDGFKAYPMDGEHVSPVKDTRPQVKVLEGPLGDS